MEVNDFHSFLHFVQFPELDALRRVRDSNPRYDVMRIPHFECGSFDHSDNSPSRELRLNTIRNTIAHGNFRRVPALPKN